MSSEFAGQEAQIQIVDQNTGDWGHILVDQVTFSEEAAQNSVERANWADYGSDFYAAISYNNLPDDQHTWVGWMSNWAYTRDTPTDPWRNAQSLPRDLSLVTVDGEVRLVQTPIEQIQDLRSGPGFHTEDAQSPEPERWNSMIRRARGRLSRSSRPSIPTRARPTSSACGFASATDSRRWSGMTAESGEVFIDRSESGLNPGEGATDVHAAPLEPDSDGQVKLHIFVDRSSVELFANDGLRTITDVIFPGRGKHRRRAICRGRRRPTRGAACLAARYGRPDGGRDDPERRTDRDQRSAELIRGYAGDDVLIGAPDDDTVAADDSYVGGPGSDVFFFDNLRRDLGNDTIQDLEATDTIRVPKRSPAVPNRSTSGRMGSST